jgi:hypothetical protein
MTEKLKQIAKEEIEKLPKDKREAVNAIDWVKITEEIGAKYLFDERKINDFQVETLLALVGLTDPQFYATNIENAVGAIKDDAVNIADEVLQKIFIPITNIGIENIKKNLKNKNPDYKQTLDFILSGGNYSAFAEEKENDTSPAVSGDKTTRPANTSRITDIKSKFVI